MKTVSVIPARGGSKRLPHKNTKKLDGIPLIAHSILYAQKHEFISDVYVSTDDDLIKEIAFKYGAIVIDRPQEISGDLEPTVSALKHVLKSISQTVDNVVLLQPTNPLRPKDLLNECFNLYETTQSDSLFTVSRNHQKLGQILDSKFIPYNYKIGQRSQDLKPLFFENGLLYISKASLIMKDIIINDNAIPFPVIHPYANVDIDTQDDFDYAEFLLKKLTNH
jgi:CMP-N-acetylneuraminic acid synthetase